MRLAKSKHLQLASSINLLGQSMKDLSIRIIQYILKKAGFRLQRLVAQEPLAPFDLLGVLIQSQVTTAGTSFYFLRIGANDGVMADTLKPLIRRHALRGCIIEPMPDLYQQLVSSYSDQSQVDIRNILLFNSSGSATVNRFKPESPLHGLALENTDLLQKRGSLYGYEYTSEICEVEKQTFTTLLDSLESKQISFLCVDTGGNDDQVIYSAFACDLYPSLVQYNRCDMSLERRHHLKMILLDHDYRFIDVGSHTFCLRIGS